MPSREPIFGRSRPKSAPIPAHARKLPQGLLPPEAVSSHRLMTGPALDSRMHQACVWCGCTQPMNAQRLLLRTDVPCYFLIKGPSAPLGAFCPQGSFPGNNQQEGCNLGTIPHSWSNGTRLPPSQSPLPWTRTKQYILQSLAPPTWWGLDVNIFEEGRLAGRLQSKSLVMLPAAMRGLF